MDIKSTNFFDVSHETSTPYSITNYVFFRFFALIKSCTFMKLCSNALLTAIICCLVSFNSIALQTLSIYCLKNTSFALLHTLHQALLPHHKTLAVLLVVGDRNCLVGTNIRAVRFEIFRTERGERQSRRLLIRQAKKKNRKISAIKRGY